MVALLSLCLAAFALAPARPLPLSHLRRLVPEVAGREIAGTFALVGSAMLLGLAAHTAVLLGALALGALIAVRRSHRFAEQRRIREALPAVAEGLAAAIRAGLPLPEALTAVAAGQEAFVAAVLRRSAALLRLGRPLEAAARQLDDVFGPSALLLRETLRGFHRRGGNAPRALERAAALARAEVALRDEVQALTAQGRVSALVLSLLAPCGLLFFLVANPAGVRAFFTEPRGQVLLTAALLLEGVGALWLWRLVKP